LPLVYFLVNVVLNHEVTVISQIKTILDEINSINYEILGVFGIYDIVVKASSDNDDDIGKVAIQKIRSIEKIQSVVTMIVNDHTESS